MQPQDFDQMIQIALKKGGFKSKRQLAFAIGVHPTTLQGWPLISKPAEEPFIELGQIVGMSPEESVLTLNMWRSKTEQTKQIYSDILRQIAHGTAALAVAVISGLFALFGAENQALAQENKREQTAIIETQDINYAIYWAG